MSKQAEKLANSIYLKNFPIDQQQLDQLKRQMEEFQKSFAPQDFKIDPQQMDQLRRQMDRLKRQMEDENALSFSNRV